MSRLSVESREMSEMCLHRRNVENLAKGCQKVSLIPMEVYFRVSFSDFSDIFTQKMTCLNFRLNNGKIVKTVNNAPLSLMTPDIPNRELHQSKVSVLTVLSRNLQFCQEIYSFVKKSTVLTKLRKVSLNSALNCAVLPCLFDSFPCS